jgi:hypothetical protein
MSGLQGKNSEALYLAKLGLQTIENCYIQKFISRNERQ